MATLYVGSDQTYKTIQAAIDAASATEANEIIISAGTYNEDITLDARTMEQKGDIKFIAAEGAEVVFAGLITIGYYEKRVGSKKWDADVAFENITFDQAAAQEHSIDVQQCNDFTMTNCKVIGDGEYGISGTNVDNGATITGTTFENAAIQSAGSFGTNFLIDDCTFNESRVNIQSGNSVTIKNSTFNGILTDANVGDSFYCVRSNDNAINIENTTFNIDSELTEVAGEQEKWGVLWQRNAGGTKWNAEDITVNFSNKAMEQTELLFNKNGTTEVANEAGRITINGLTSTDNDVTDLLAKSEGILNAAADGKFFIYDDGQLIKSVTFEKLYVDAAFTADNVGEGKIFGANAFTSFVDALKAVAANTGRIEISSNITEDIPAELIEVALSRNIEIVGTDEAVSVVTLNNGGYKYLVFGSAEGAEDVAVKISNIKIVAPQTQVIFGNSAYADDDSIVYSPVNAEIDGSSLVSAYVVAVETGSTVNVLDGGKFFSTGEVMNIKGTLNATGNDAFDPASDTLTGDDRQIVAHYMWDYGTVELNDTFASVYSQLRLRGADSSFTADNSLIEIGKKVDGTWMENPSANGVGWINADGTMTLTNKTIMRVNGATGRDGYGMTINAGGEFNVESGSTAEFSAGVKNDGTIKVDNGTLITGNSWTAPGTQPPATALVNNGTVNVSGESTLNIAELSGNTIDFMDGAIIKDSTVGGGVFVAGNVTFRGDNTFGMITDFGTLTDYYGTTAPMAWTVEAGASVTLNNKARYGLGYGDKVVINGEIAENGAAAARAALNDDDASNDVKQSLFMHGLVAQESAGWNCDSSFTVNNAFVTIGSNSSFGSKAGNYGGNYTFNFNNSVLNSSRITFYNTNAKTTFTLTGSDVELGQFMTRDQDSVFTLDNSKLVSTSTINGNDEGQYNAGTLNLINGSTLTYSSAMTNEATGKIVISADSKLIAPEIIMVDGASITIDGTGFTSGTNKVIDLNGTESLQGKITIENLEEGITVAYGKDGDVLITDASMEKLWVNSAYVDKEFGTVDGDKVFGINALSSLTGALDAKTADTEEIVIESDIADELSGRTISGKLTADSAVTVTDSANSTYVNFTGTTLDKNITVDAKYFYLYGENTFNGNVKSSTTFYSSGKLTLTGNAEVYTTMSRYYANADDGIYVVGTAAAGEGKNAAVQYKSINYLGHYSGTFSVKDTAAEFGYILLNGDTDGDGYSKAQLVLDNAKVSTIGGPNTQPGQVLMNGDAAIIATNGSVLDFRGPKDFGYISMGENNSISLTDSEMYLGQDGQGSNTLAGTITLTNSTLNSLGKITNNGTLNITGKSEVTGSITNNGTVSISGETSTDLTVTGNAVEIEDGAVITDTTITGNVNLKTGESSWSGTNTVSGEFSAGYYNYGGDLTTSITGTFTNSSLLSWAQDGSKTVVNIGSAEADRTTFNGGQIGEFENSTINIVNADVTYSYAFIRGNFNLTDSTMTNSSINTYFSGQAVAVVDNSTWNIGSYVTIGSYGGSYMAGNADVTLQNGAEMNVGNLEIYEAEGKTVKLTINNSTLNSTGALTISTGAEVILNEGALINASGTLTNDGQIIVDVTDTWQGVAKIIDVAEGKTVDTTNIKLNDADAANGVQIKVDDDGDLLVYKVPVEKLYVNAAWNGKFAEKVAEGKYMDINAFNTLSGYVASESTKALEIAGGTYSQPEGNYTNSVSVIKGGITDVTTDGEVVIDKGSLVFATETAGEINISGDFKTTDKVRYTGTWGVDWAESQNGHIRFVGGDDTIFNIDGKFTAGENIQFIGGSAVISENSVLSNNPANWGQYLINGANVINKGAMSLELNAVNGSAMNILGGGSLTLSGEKASLNINMKDGGESNKDINVTNGSLNVEDGAKLDVTGAVTVAANGAITIDNAAFSAAVLTNSNVITIKGAAELAIGKLVNADATLNIENFTNEFNLAVEGGTIKVTGELKLGADADIAGAVLDGGKLVISGADQTVQLAENSTVTLVVDKAATLTADDDLIGNVDITGENAELTADDALFNGNKVSGVKLAITNADGEIYVDAALADIAKINGNEVKNFDGIYYFTEEVTNDNGTPDDTSDDVISSVTNILSKDENGISYAEQGSGGGDGSVDGEKEFGNIVIDNKTGDSINPDLDVVMKKGTTTIKVVDDKKAEGKTRFEIGSISKNENGGKTNFNFGNNTDVDINGSVEAMGDLVVGKDSDLDIEGTLNGKNINQSIKIGANSTANFADIDLMGGKNSFSVAAGATVTAKDVEGITTLNLAAGKENDRTTMTVNEYVAAAANNSITLGNYADLTIAGMIDNGGVESGTGTTIKAGNYATINVADEVNGLAGMTLGKESTFEADSISGTEKANKINLGADATLTTGAIDLKDGKNSISLGKEADFTAASIANVQTITLAAGATATIVDDVNDLQKLTVGKDADFKAANLYGTEANDKITVSGELNLSGNLDLGSGKNTIALGKEAYLEADSIANVQTITLAADADLTAAGINGVQKLTLGKAATLDVDAVLEGVQKFTAGNESEVYLPGLNGTEKNDAFTFGNDSTIGSETEKVAFNAYAGNDSIKIGNNAIAHIASIDLGDGKDTVTLGKDSKIFVDEITNVETINASKGSQIITGSDVNFDAVGGSWKNATIMDVDNVLTDNAGAGAVYGNEWDLYDLAAGTTSVMIADETNSNTIYKVYEKGAWDKAVGEITSIDTQFIGSLDASKNYVLAVSVEGADFKNKEDEANKYSFTLLA